MHTESGKGIVHGDLHPGNIARLGDGSYGLIDFGMAFFRDEYGPDDDITRSSKSYAHCFFSHYNIMGYRFGPRDDVFKALLSAAFLMTGLELFDNCMEFQANADGMYLFHRNGNYFNSKLISKAEVAGGNSDIEKAIAKHLEMTLVLARSVDGVNDLPNYDEITRHASAVWSIIDSVGKRISVPAESLVVPDIELPIVTSVRLDRAQLVFTAFSQGTNAVWCSTLIESVSVKLVERGDEDIEFAYMQDISKKADLSRMVLSEFESELMSLLENEGVVERLSPAVGLADDCNGKLVFRTASGGISKHNMLDLKNATVFASSVFSLLKTVHSLGLCSI